MGGENAPPVFGSRRSCAAWPEIIQCRLVDTTTRRDTPPPRSRRLARDTRVGPLAAEWTRIETELRGKAQLHKRARCSGNTEGGEPITILERKNTTKGRKNIIRRGAGCKRFSRANLVYQQVYRNWVMHCRPTANGLNLGKDLRGTNRVQENSTFYVWRDWEESCFKVSKLRVEVRRPSPVPIDGDFSWGRGGKIEHFAIPENVAPSSDKFQRQQKGER